MALEDDLVPSKPQSTSTTSLAIVMYWVIFANSVGKTAMGVQIPFDLMDFGASPITVGVVQTILGGVGIAGTLAGGLLSDLIGRKGVGVPCYAVTVVLQGATLFAPGLWQLIPVQVLYSLCSMAARASFVACLSDVVDQTDLPVALGYLTLADQGGQFLGCALSGAFPGCGYPCVALVSSSLIFVTLVLAMALVPKKSGDATGIEEALLDDPIEEEEEEEEPALKVFLGFMQNSRYRQIWSVHMFVNFGYVTYLSFISMYLHDTYNATAATFGQATSEAGVFVLLVQICFMKWLVEHLTESSIVILGLLCRLVGAVVLASWISPYATVTSLSFVSIGTGMLEPCLMALAVTAAPATARGAALSTYKTATLLGETLGPLAGGTLYSEHHTAPFWAAAVVMGLAVLGICYSDRSQRLAGEEVAPTEMEMTNHMMAATMSTKKGKRKTMAAYMLIADTQMQPMMGKVPTYVPGPRLEAPRRQTAPDIDVGRRKLSVWQPRASAKSKSCVM